MASSQVKNRLVAGLCLAAAGFSWTSAAEATVCGGDLKDIVTPQEIKLSARSFKLALPPERFRLEKLSLRDEGPCAPDGKSSLVVEAIWFDLTTERWVQVAQRSGKGQASFFDDRTARLSHEGFDYGVTLDPLSGSSAEVPGSDREQLLLVVRALVPDFEISCAYHPVQGTWSDLQRFGLGDLRPALPSGFKETAFDLRFLAAPEPSCTASGPSLSAELVLAASFADSKGGTLAAAARDLPSGSVLYPGILNDSVIAWSDGSREYRIDGSAAEGASFEQGFLEGLAKALDPKFSTDCLLKTSFLKAEDLQALGFREPAAGEAYQLSASSLTRQAVSDSCGQSLLSRGRYVLSWDFREKEEPGGLGIAVHVVRPIGEEPSAAMESEVEESSLSWTDGQGTSYSVSGYALGEEEEERTVPMDDLVAVAKSLDPGFQSGAVAQKKLR